MSARRVAALALVLLASACAGSGADKAGGGEEAAAQAPAEPVGKPVTLTLATVDDLWATEFAAAAARLSGGSIRIRVRIGGGAIVDYERTLVKHVRVGRADLVSIGARAWDRMGVTSFQGLVAPFLVDSFELQRRALATRTVARMLRSLEPLGLVGLAVLPGPLRRPLGVSRPFLGPKNYAGAAFGIRFGRVADASVRALGATPKGYRIGSLAGLDGAELDLATIANNGYEANASALTANVVLWARPETIAIGREAFGRLGPAQREILRRAGRAAVAPVLAKLELEQQEALAALCGHRRLTFAAASAAELAALRAAVRPVYRELERDPETGKAIAEIRRLAAGARGAPLRCPGAGGAGAAALEGEWSATATRDELLAAGALRKETVPGSNTWTLELRDGLWASRHENGQVRSGVYEVAGEHVLFTLRTCTRNPCTPGAAADYRWSRYRDRLSLSALPGEPPAWALASTPFTRVR